MFLFRKHLRNESVFEMKVKFVVFETLFCFFFPKKCQKQNIFRGARMGHHTPGSLCYELSPSYFFHFESCVCFLHLARFFKR